MKARMRQGAMTLAEGSQKQDYRTDASLILNGAVERGYVLRTAYDPLAVWKAKYAKGVSPFYPRLKTGAKETALIDDEIWVFGVDGTNSQHIVDAVNIACQFYKVDASYILHDVYIKNLNAESEQGMALELLVRVNKKLYESTVAAIRKTCQHFGIKGNVNIHVYSAAGNQKIPANELHDALRSGGATRTEMDARQLNYRSGSNDGQRRARIDTNLHVARLDL